nr:MAG TPA_asm: hypothetical protein [Bacteriophage sp.]
MASSKRPLRTSPVPRRSCFGQMATIHLNGAAEQPILAPSFMPLIVLPSKHTRLFPRSM